MLTASQLFARSEPGEHKCYYCGYPCGCDNAVKQWVKPTFTNRDAVREPGSEYICGGCLATLEPNKEIVLVDGTVHPPNPRISPRMFSWVLEQDRKRAYSKAHMAQMRKVVLNPPNPPFAIILSDSGQKQLIFRAPVAMGRDYYRLLFEEEVVNVNLKKLQDRIVLATKLAAAIGKPGLKDFESSNQGIRVFDYYGSLDLLDEWNEVRAEPLSRLAAWLAPPMEECKNEHPKIISSRIQTTSGRVDGSGTQTSRQNRQTGRKASLHQPSFDFAAGV